MKLPRLALVGALLAGPALSQVHYHDSGAPWNQQARRGPDQVVDGWYYNLGVTGLRVQLLADAPRELLVKHVFEGSPAAHKVRVGDRILGVRGRRFQADHRNGYGMQVFGAEGPILEFGEALEACLQGEQKGRLPLTLRREDKLVETQLSLGTRHGAYSRSYPEDCEKSERILGELLDYLVEHQHDNGTWGREPNNTFAALALIASGKQEHLRAARKCARFLASNTRDEDEGWLINWRYMAAGIVLSEYYLATRERWVIEELEEIYTFLHGSQYMDLSQVNPKVRESHPNAWPKDAQQQHGGWGHNPGFEGYGPIAMITGQGALAFALMAHCGVEVDRQRHDAAYAFLERGTGRNGYVWYKDEGAGDQNWADMGRTGAAGIANHLSPHQGRQYGQRARAHAGIIGSHPESFPDTHGSPIMGMGYAALAAHVEERAFRRLMDANRYWFTLSQCHDGSFYYQPNRDNAGYGPDSRISASAVTALIFSIPKKSLAVTGRSLGR